MIIRFLLLAMLFTAAGSVRADERLYLKFELIQGGKTIERGNAIVSGKSHVWSKGVQRSYLRLRCNQSEPGKTQKLYSTVDHFSGLRVTHKLAGDTVELSVVHNDVRPRLTEIRALAKGECRDLSPVVASTTRTYSYLAKDDVDETRPFGENTSFRITIQSIGKKR